MTSAIVLHDLTKTYAGNRGIRNLRLTIERGEIFGFLGPNGAGKSTTLRTLLGFMTPTSGSAEILGMDVATQRDRIHQQVGNLPGEFQLDNHLTGRQLLVLFGRLRAISSLDYGLELGRRLDADLDRPMRRLSRGNKQKIGIIQALFHQPDIVILDEPTGGLDPLAQETFLEFLEEAKSRGQTILFSSHILPEVERVADRVGIIRDGELVTVQETARLTELTFRHVRMQLPPGDDLGQRLAALCRAAHLIDGVRNLTLTGNTIAFDAHGDINAVVRLADQVELAALDVERPTLDEVFQAYYQHDGASRKERSR